MLLLSTLVFAASACALTIRAGDQTCPPLPSGFAFGSPVAVTPGDIPNGCSEYEILVARGTSEPNFEPEGKFGVIIGDSIVSNVSKLLAGVQGYPVQYPADGNFIQNLEDGGHDMADRIAAQAEKCPDQTFALVGYSQGAGVVKKAAEFLPLELHGKIKSISTFGDPSEGENEGGIWPTDWPYGLQGKVRHVCAEGDPICDITATCFYNHLIYIRPLYIDAAVSFIIDSFVNSWSLYPTEPAPSSV